MVMFIDLCSWYSKNSKFASIIKI